MMYRKHIKHNGLEYLLNNENEKCKIINKHTLTINRANYDLLIHNNQVEGVAVLRDDFDTPFITR